ncbi:MAG TPA: tRNA uridine-5-carboxymethylaminomethyl(34) synthesis enzyme MnmG, partial [Ferruginibacter sp.]|nr:tRNA uridine-5-carboxymethylaminomethyl(34) synthesis enzyme MnmG [Ferruginibacter sp.]
LLRQDNADIRLTETSFNAGLAGANRMQKLEEKLKQVNHLKSYLQQTALEPADINPYLESVGSAPLQNKQKAAQVLLRPGISLNDMQQHTPTLHHLNALEKEICEQAEIQIKYETYINKEKEMVKKMNELENLSIPDNFNFEKLVSLSAEARQKFSKIKPRTLGQASRISGVSPSDVQILMVYMGR